MHKPLTLAASAVALALAALAPLAAAQAQAQAWPSQPLKALVPFGPGSSPDQVARIVTEKRARCSARASWSRTSPAPAATSAPMPSPMPSPTATPSACPSPARW